MAVISRYNDVQLFCFLVVNVQGRSHYIVVSSQQDSNGCKEANVRSGFKDALRTIQRFVCGKELPSPAAEQRGCDFLVFGPSTDDSKNGSHPFELMVKVFNRAASAGKHLETDERERREDTSFID